MQTLRYTTLALAAISALVVGLKFGLSHQHFGGGAILGSVGAGFGVGVVFVMCSIKVNDYTHDKDMLIKASRLRSIPCFPFSKCNQRRYPQRTYNWNQGGGSNGLTWGERRYPEDTDNRNQVSSSNGLTWGERRYPEDTDNRNQVSRSNEFNNNLSYGQRRQD